MDPAKETARQTAKPAAKAKAQLAKRPPRTDAWTKQVERKQKKLSRNSESIQPQVQDMPSKSGKAEGDIGAEDDYSEDDRPRRKKQRVGAGKRPNIQVEFQL